MTTRIEGARTGDLILKEAPQRFSREEVTIAAGADLRPGSVLGQITASGKYVFYSPAATDGSQTPIAVLATYARAASADVRATVISREAKLLQTALVFHPDVKTVAQRQAAIAALGARRILANGKALISVLDLIGWHNAAYPLRFSQKGAVWQSSFDRNDYLPDSAIVTTYYVDLVTGTSGGDGLSWATAKQAPWQAFAAANATGQPAKVILRKDQTFFRAMGLNNSGTVLPTVPIYLTVESGGRAAITMHDNLTFTAAGSSYTAPLNSAASVWDILNKDANGDYARFTRLATEAEVDAATVPVGVTRGGVYWQSGSLSRFKRWDGQLVTNANTRVYRRQGQPLVLGSGFSNQKIVVDRVDFEGGAGNSCIMVLADATNVVAMLKDCTFKYALDEQATGIGGAHDGVTHLGTGLVMCDSCTFAQLGKDAVNGSGELKNYTLTQNCTDRALGLIAANGSNNAFTGHKNSVMISVNDNWSESEGPTVAFIDDTRFLVLGSKIGPDRSGRGFSMPQAVCCLGRAVGYLIDVVTQVTTPASDYAIRGLDSSEINVRNIQATGLVVGAKAMPAEVYVP